MKKIITTFFLILSLIYISCNNSDYSNSSKIKVGMTYDEVESILNKPESITRGATELYSDVDELSNSILRRLNLDTTNIKNEPKHWLTPQKIQTIGNLIYVTWMYNKTKKDTFYIVLNNFKEIKDTTTYKTPYYYLGNKQVSKSEYLNSDGYEYKLQDNRIVDKSIYEVYKESHLYKLAKPRKIKKKIEYKFNKAMKSHEEKSSTEKKYYEVNYTYCVTFDASSGRVTNEGFFPSKIKYIK